MAALMKSAGYCIPMPVICLFVLTALIAINGHGTFATEDVNVEVTVPHDVATAYILHVLDLKDDEIINRVDNSQFSDYFIVLDNGTIMTLRDLAPLVGKTINMKVYSTTAAGKDIVYRIYVVVKDSSSMQRFLREKYDGSVYENLPAETEPQQLGDLEAVGENNINSELTGRKNNFAVHQLGSIPSVVTIKSLDRDAQSLYKPHTNDHAPVFSQDVFYFHVNLNISRFETIGRVLASDEDGDDFTYRLVHPSNIFTVVAETGDIMLIGDPKALVYDLELEAHDEGKPTLYSGNLALAHIEFYFPGDAYFFSEKSLEKNEVTPIQSRTRRSMRVNRGKLRPTKKITFSEADGSMEGKLAFQLEREMQWETFKIREVNPWVEVNSNGAVSVKNKWDYEVLGPEKIIQFWVAITNNKTSDTDYQRVIMQITDVNDELPFFTNYPLPIQTVVDLNAAPNIPVYTLQAQDPDNDHDIHYFLVRDRTGGQFEVDEESGVIRRRGTEPILLNLEYVLYVKAEDHNGRTDDNSYQSTPEERISIVGGKRPPQFYLPKYEKSIPESTPKDHDLIVVEAKSFADRKISYAISVKEGAAGTFEIGHTSGIVKLATELDFEDVAQPHSYLMIVTATENSSGFSTSVYLTINVTDVNDNTPTFDLPDYQAHNIDEDLAIGSSILRVKATDEDAGTNAEIEYSVSDDTFRVDDEGIIYSYKTLDADDNNAYYECTVTATDGGELPRKGTATIRVYMKNKNDETPMFSQQVYTPNVDENAGRNTLVTTVTASDKDGDNVEFGFTGGQVESGQFVIDKRTGVIRLHNGQISLDRDKYELNVTAVDDGSCCPGGSLTRHTSTAVVVVFITDINDNKPTFMGCSSYHAKVEESAPIGTPVITVHASDEDKGSNGQVRYSIVQQPHEKETKFAIDLQTGEVTTNKVFDHEGEKGKFAYATVRATDDGDPSLEGICSFTVEITDINEHPPLSDKQFIIDINDANLLPPKFERSSYIITLEEELSTSKPLLLLQVKANVVDNDGKNIVYFLSGQGIDVENPENSLFEIDTTSGAIFVKKPLDRDQPTGRSTWQFLVFAQDEGGAGPIGYADVQVNLTDINDNSPIFPHLVYYGNVIENSTQGIVAMTMTANDYDDINEGTNAKLTYFIEKNSVDENKGTPIFEIDPDTGVIKTSVCCLDREKTRDYSIQVVAMDGGGLKGTGTASIRVQDINDMPPKFTKEKWVIEVDETEGKILPDHGILTVTVEDDDETNKFHYKVIESSGYAADKFSMVRNDDGTGSLKIVKPLDYDDRLQRNGFQFRIEVNDKGGDIGADKYHVAYSWVRVKLRDINDNKPQFTKHNIKVTVFEDAVVGKSLATFKAVDIDKAGMSEVSYAIDRSTDRRRQFAIDHRGTVTIQRSLDREVNSRHSVKILAIDDGTPAKTGTATLTVIVQDINDNAPRFLEIYRSILSENQPPRKIVEVLAKDDDDGSKGNGPPFHFRLHSIASDVIRASFKVDNRVLGGNGDGMAVISSLRSFDREMQKEFHVPIIIRDSGVPRMTGTSTLTIIIGDENDHKMFPESKSILVYRRNTLENDMSPIGRVFVSDLDDWDLSDKKFIQLTNNSNFGLNEDDGMIYMRLGTPEGTYFLRFLVDDRKHSQIEVKANVTIIVREISEEAVINSGSIRIANLDAESFIRIWDYKDKKVVESKYEKFREVIAKLVGTSVRNVDVFSVIRYQNRPHITDVRFSVHGSSYNQQVKLNGLVLLYKKEIEETVGIDIAMVSIDECLHENKACDGSCTNNLVVSLLPHMVNANKTSFVGVSAEVVPECTCGARNFSREESCLPNPCFNDGRCIVSESGVRCLCNPGFDGPRCQTTTRYFSGYSYALFPAIEACDNTHVSLEFLTTEKEGIIFYNGPIAYQAPEDEIISDFISLELVGGRPRLLIDFGSGTLELNVQRDPLSNGEWHRIDVFWDTKTVRMVVDNCVESSVSEAEDGSDPIFNSTGCQAKGQIPPFNEYLNVNAPLQLGGLANKLPNSIAYNWNFRRQQDLSFQGCIRNFIVNSKIYDLTHPGLSRSTQIGCFPLEESCRGKEIKQKCSQNGVCYGSVKQPICKCKPGWAGPSCDEQTNSSYFEAQSYVKYALSFKPNSFSTEIQLRFRTWQENGELFRLSEYHGREYAILAIKDGHLRFTYNMNIFQTEENVLWLSAITVNDGQWHSAAVERHGSTAMLMLDGGEGRRFNETVIFAGQMLLSVDRQGVYAGGRPEYTGIRSFHVYNDFKLGCLDDIRLNGKHLALPPALNGTQWSQAIIFRNLQNDCISPDQCVKVTCPASLTCKNLWMRYECWN